MGVNSRENTYFLQFQTYSKCADQSAHPHTLGTNNVSRCQGSKITALANLNFSKILACPCSLADLFFFFFFFFFFSRERSGSLVECLTRNRGAAGSSLIGATALWSLSKTHLS